MLKFVFYFKDKEILFSTLYLKEILKFTIYNECSIIFIEDKISSNIKTLKSYSDKIISCSWEELLSQCRDNDFHWFISEEIRFTAFDFHDLLVQLYDNRHNYFYINPIINLKDNFKINFINSNNNYTNLKKICDSIFIFNSSYWIFSGEYSSTIIRKFMNGDYTDFLYDSDINTVKSNESLNITDFDFHLRHYFNSSQLESFLKYINKFKDNYFFNNEEKCKFIFLILSINPKIFFKLITIKPLFLLSNFLNLDLSLLNTLLSKIGTQFISIIIYNIKEKGTFLLSIFYNFKYWIKNFYSNKKLLKEDNCLNIISLTTYKDRINTVYLTLESIWNQSIIPSKVILVLSNVEFKNELELPNSLKRLVLRGLEIKFVDGNVKSFKKLVYTYNNSNVITIDDDIIYPSWWYETLLVSVYNNPGVVISYGCKRIVHSEFFTFMPYTSFTYATSKNSSFLNLPIGAYGVFYPCNSLHSDLPNADKYLYLAPNADDVWFKAMSVLNNVKSCQVFNDPPFFCHTLFSQSKALSKQNYYMDMNDIYIWNVFNHYKKFINDQF